jgi:TonB-linked SusC/RagA family outer membrane protein
MRKVLVILTMCLAISVSALAQTTVTGRVSGDDGLGIPGVSVLERGTTNGTVTNVDGDYSIRVGANATLVFSFMGYATQEVPLEGRTSVNVTLELSTLAVDEVVVTALGIRRERKALGYSVQDIKGDDLMMAKETNVINSLSGKIAGLQLIKSGNGIGGSTKINIRGNSSLVGNNQPLIVVDGIPMDNFIGGGSEWMGVDYGSGISDINPDDIESMSVLKGASAATLYGNRAGNGVILITTKKGSVKRGAGITVTSNLTFEDMLTYPDLQNTFSQGTEGNYVIDSQTSWGAKIAGQMVDYWAGGQRPLTADVDGFRNFLSTGLTSTNTVSFDRVVDDNAVRASLTHMNSAGMTPNENLERTSFNIRGSTKMGEKKRWTVDSKLNYVRSIGENRPTLGINQSNIFYTFYIMPRTVQVRDLDPPTDATGKRRWYAPEDVPSQNPYWKVHNDLNRDVRDRFLGFMSVKYDFTDWMNLEVKYGADLYSLQIENTLKSGGIVRPAGAYSVSTQNFLEGNATSLLNLNKQNIDDSGFSAGLTLGGNLMHRKSQTISGNSDNLVIPGIYALSNGIKPTVGHDRGEKNVNSALGSAQVSYKDFIYLDYSFRNDWTSTLSPDNWSFFYNGISAGWVANEMFKTFGVNLPEFITFAKVRASYAEVGNDLPPYQLYNTYSIGTNFFDYKTINSGSVLYNQDVQNELIKESELGLDLKLFDNRFGLDLTFYKKNATNQLLNLPVPNETGYSSKIINAGNIQNQGTELMAYADVLRSTRGLSWRIILNYSKNENTILELAEGIANYSLGGSEHVNVYATVGGNYGDIWGRRLNRVTDETSPYFDQIIVDANGLPTRTNDKFLLGTQQPDWLGGIANELSYKNVSLRFLIDMRKGGDIYSGTSANNYWYGTALETADNDRADFVVPNSVISDGQGGYTENTKLIKPQHYWQRVAGRDGAAEEFLYDATNVRLREVTLSYNLGNKVLSKTPFTRATFSFVGRNLWLIQNNLPGVDPESVYGTNTNAPALETGPAPTTRSLGFNVILGF